MIDAADLTGMTFDELTAYVKEQAVAAKPRCPETAKNLSTIALMMDTYGPGDGNKTRQVIVDTINTCTGSGVVVGAVAAFLAGGFVAWLLLR